MDAAELKQHIAQNVEPLARHLFPNGQRQRTEFKVGSIHGEKGQSLSISLSGPKAGVWADYATSESGDMYALYQLVKGVSWGQAVDEIRSFYGFHKPEFIPAGNKTYKKPDRPQCQSPKNTVKDYLTVARKLSDETIKAFKVAEEGNMIVFPYLRNGELVMWKKDSIERTPEGKRAKSPFASKETEPILFGWQAVELHYPDTRRIFLTEGELDAMSLFQYGYPALSVPFGGGAGAKQQWITSEFENLLRFEEVFLVLDNDKPGQEAAAAIIERLGALRCRIVTLPVPHKDANDCLKAGVDKAIVDECVRKARSNDPEELKGVSDLWDNVEREFDTLSGDRPFFEMPWRKTHEELRLEASQLTIWGGYNGHGKSEVLLNYMVHRIAAGEKVLMASMEVPYQKLIARHLLPQITAMSDPSPAYRAAVRDWLTDQLWFFTLVGTAKAERLLTIFEYARKKYGIQHFVLDSLLKVGLDENDYDAQKRFIERLCDFKNSTGAHVHLVAHARKQGETGEYEAPKKHDIRGSGTITDLADNLLMVFREKRKGEFLNEFEGDENIELKPKWACRDKDPSYKLKDVKRWSDATLICHKQKERTELPQYRLWFDSETKRFLESPSENPRPYVQYSGPPVINSVTQYQEQDTPIAWEQMLTDEEVVAV